MNKAQAVRAAVVPGWLAEVVRPRRAPVPWPEMIRAALAICVPLSVALALGRGSLGVLPAMGGILGAMADTGGPYLNRVKRVCAAAVGGGAVGLAIGAVTHGHGWLAVVALVVVAGVSGVISTAGAPAWARLRRPTYRALADLLAEFQRTMSEPPSMSRRAAAWWPAVIGLEQVMDAFTAAGLAASRPAEAVSADGVRRLSDALRAIGTAAGSGTALASVPDLPDDDTLRPVSEAIRSLLGVLGPGQRLTLPG